MGELSKLPNIGKTLEEQLEAVGISTDEQLKEIGSKQAWLKIKAVDDTACINMLQALEGAVRGVKKKELTEEVKEDLREFYREMK